MMRRTPGFTAVAVLTLALGIGANTAIFSVVNAVLWREMPIRAPGEIVSFRDAGRPGMFANSFSYPNYRDVRDRNRVFSDVIAYRLAPVGLTHEGQSQRVWCYMVSGNYFTGLGVTAHRGRLLAPEDDTSPGAIPW
jgi:hypothetical protein